MDTNNMRNFQNSKHYPSKGVSDFYISVLTSFLIQLFTT